ncbi:MAG: HIT family protein [Bacteroidota bacterium]
MPSIFSRIISGEIPSYKIAENENFLAFLDISPLKKGHVLVVPKKEVDYVFDLDNDLYIGLMSFTKEIAIAIKKSIPCNRIGVCVIGLEVPHAHIHLIPINTESDMNFRNEKLKLSNEEFETIASTIRTSL